MLGRALLYSAAGLLSLILVLLIHVQLVSFSASYYQSEFAKLDRPAALGTSLDQLARFSRQTTRYLAGLESEPNVSLVLYGQERLLLNEREITHMRDVQRLFAVARAMTASGLLLFVLGGLFLWRRGRLVQFFRMVALAAGLALVIGLVFGLLISQDFTVAFDRFHWLAFTNDLWQLNPQEDQLINLLPEQFFADAALLASLRTALTLLVVSATAGFASLRPNRPKLS